jgi:hypothetical protein
LNFFRRDTDAACHVYKREIAAKGQEAEPYLGVNGSKGKRRSRLPPNKVIALATTTDPNNNKFVTTQKHSIHTNINRRK